MSLFTTDSARPLGKGLQSPAGSVRDSELSVMFRNYKRGIASRYRAIVRDEIEQTLRGPLMVSPKIDGEIWFLVMGDGEAFFASPSGRVISGAVPALQEVAKAADKAHTRTVVAGELFAARKTGRPRVGDLAAAMGGEAKAEVERIAFAAFDSLQGGHRESPQQMPLYGDRLQSLRQLFDGGKRVKAVKTESVEGGAPVAQLFEEWVAGGKGEGLVIRTADNLVYKAKPTINIDAVIMGYTESSEGPDRVGSLLLGLMREDGQVQVIGACGNMPTEQRLAFM
jgi:ATP-dependent DNA ligase